MVAFSPESPGREIVGVSLGGGLPHLHRPFLHTSFAARLDRSQRHAHAGGKVALGVFPPRFNGVQQRQGGLHREGRRHCFALSPVHAGFRSLSVHAVNFTCSCTERQHWRGFGPDQPDAVQPLFWRMRLPSACGQAPGFRAGAVLHRSRQYSSPDGRRPLGVHHQDARYPRQGASGFSPAPHIRGGARRGSRFRRVRAVRLRSRFFSRGFDGGYSPGGHTRGGRTGGGHTPKYSLYHPTNRSMPVSSVVLGLKPKSRSRSSTSA